MGLQPVGLGPHAEVSVNCYTCRYTTSGSGSRWGARIGARLVARVPVFCYLPEQYVRKRRREKERDLARRPRAEAPDLPGAAARDERPQAEEGLRRRAHILLPASRRVRRRRAPCMRRNLRCRLRLPSVPLEAGSPWPFYLSCTHRVTPRLAVITLRSQIPVGPPLVNLNAIRTPKLQCHTKRSLSWLVRVDDASRVDICTGGYIDPDNFQQYRMDSKMHIGLKVDADMQSRVSITYNTMTIRDKVHVCAPM